jgi:hypothetical protein
MQGFEKVIGQAPGSKLLFHSEKTIRHKKFFYPNIYFSQVEVRKGEKL